MRRASKPPESPPSRSLSRTERAFRTWARQVLRWRWTSLALIVMLTVMAGQRVVNVVMETSIEALLPRDSAVKQSLEALRATFGRDDVFLVLVEGDVFSPIFLERLRELHTGLEKLQLPESSAAAVEAEPVEAVVEGDDFFADDEGWGDEAGGSVIDEVISLINARRTEGRAGTLTVGEWLTPWPDTETLPTLKKEALSDRTLVGQVVDKAGEYAVVVVRTVDLPEADLRRLYGEINRLTKRFDDPAFRIDVAGLPALNTALNSLMERDLQMMLLWAFLVMVVILSINFRHPIGVLGPLVVVGLSAVWMVGCMVELGYAMTVLSNILPAFLICVGIGDSVHLLSVYRDLRYHGMENQDAIQHAVGSTALPILFTSLTTMVGLLSFRMASSDVIGEMGTVGAIGVAIACLHSLVLLPILLTFNPRSHLGAGASKRMPRIDRMLETFSHWSYSRRARVVTLGIAAVLVIASLAALSWMRVWHNPLAWVPEGQPIKAAFERLDAAVGGTASVEMMVEALPGKTLKDVALFEGLEQLETHAKAYVHPDGKPLVTHTLSLLDVVKETHQALNDGDSQAYRLPDSDRGVGDMLFLFENAAPDELRRLATLDMEKTNMTLRIRWMDATSYLPLAAHLEEGIATHIGDAAKVTPTGAVYTLVTTVASIIGDLLRSFGTAFVVITGIMMVLLRSVRLGIIAMVPNLLPIVFLLGLMALLDIPIDMANLMVASIAIGIAVDDTIHFLHHFQNHYRYDSDVEASIASAFNHAGRAMVLTSLVLIAGFSVYMSASMLNIQRFGLLVALTVVLALLTDLILTPAVLRLVYRTKKPTPAGAKTAQNSPVNQAQRECS